MQYSNFQMIYQLTGLLFFLSLNLGCRTDRPEKTIDQQEKKLISFNSYQDNSDSKNSIFLQLADSGKSEIKFINVKLTHGAGCTPMNNLVVDIYIDNNGYWMIMDDFRFLEKEFNSVNDTTIEKVIYLDLCKFRKFTDSVDIHYSELRNLIYSSKRISILASMSDMALLKNPRSSSSLRRSNLIELNYE